MSSDAAPVPVPPGWYPAGVAGQERWWNGTAWTGQVRVVDSSLPRPSDPAGRPEAAASGFWRGSADGSLAGGIIVALPALILLLLGLVGTLNGALAGSLLAVVQGVVFSLVGLALAAVAVLLLLNHRGLRRAAAHGQTAEQGQDVAQGQMAAPGHAAGAVPRGGA